MIFLIKVVYNTCKTIAKVRYYVYQREGNGPAGGLELPGTRPTATTRWEATVDERILAQHAQHSLTYPEHEGREKRRSCFYCLEGWVFLGSIGHDGEVVVEAVRCRRCNGTGRIEIH